MMKVEDSGKGLGMRPWKAYGLLVLFNVAFTVLIQYWERLLYWCLEGRVPPILIFGSIGLIAGAWLLGNRLIVRRSSLDWRKGIGAVALVVAIVLLDPWVRPLYMNQLDNLAMFQSFRILEYFRKG
ncbi:hypothetical protein [Paenibacillus silviterrae]|uniref:hypothetical protein n=1 Tax=Paenibacillus silviterrae TaxID=3242194 RepID=UPI00254310FA|nr:hypothetical protein [Paenibacillus chinjuensis]